MARSPTNRAGIVYLVGAGPGDPLLITLKGVKCLQSADLVLYDYLVNSRILQHAQPQAQVVCLGQHGKSRLWSQDEINSAMLQAASQGKTVVRLKGGDPAVFARGAEEAEFLSREGIPFEVVPGITTALAAGSCTGIPLTHRELSSAVALVTGQERPSKADASLDYRALAKFPGTIVVYMGVTTVQRWTEELMDGGLSPQTPAAIIRRCSLPDQTTVLCKLAEVAAHLTPRSRIPPPVIVIIGNVAHAGQDLSWFEKRPLFGQRVLVTRPEGQLADLTESFEALGAFVMEHPTITIGPPQTWDAVDAAIRHIRDFDWLVFSSVNGVRYFLGRLFDLELDGRELSNTRIATIGPGTTNELRRFRFRSDLQPTEYRAEALAAALATHASGKRFLLVRASRGREVLADQLEAAGGSVEQVVCYNSQDVVEANTEIAEQLCMGKIDWVTVTSSAIARSLVNLYGENLKQTKIASISPVTTATLQDLGQAVAVEAKQFTMAGVVEAIRAAVLAD